MSKWSVNAKVFIALVTVALGTIVFGLFQSPSAAENSACIERAMNRSSRK